MPITGTSARCAWAVRPGVGVCPAWVLCARQAQARQRQRITCCPLQALAQDVVYDLIPTGQRRDWHERLAGAMEALNMGVGVPGGFWRGPSWFAPTLCKPFASHHARSAPGGPGLHHRLALGPVLQWRGGCAGEDCCACRPAHAVQLRRMHTCTASRPASQSCNLAAVGADHACHTLVGAGRGCRLLHGRHRGGVAAAAERRGAVLPAACCSQAAACPVIN